MKVVGFATLLKVKAVTVPFFFFFSFLLQAHTLKKIVPLPDKDVLIKDIIIHSSVHIMKQAHYLARSSPVDSKYVLAYKDIKLKAP